MKKSTLISLAALAVAVLGVLIALAAYFKKKHDDTVLDDFDDELYYDDLEDDTEYYEAHLEDECEECCCGNCDACCEEACCDCGCCEECCAEEAVEEPQA